MRVLFIAYYFPPDASSGAFRPFFFVNHLIDQGDEVHILTARESDFLVTQPRDASMLERLDPKVRITRCRVRRVREKVLAWRDKLTIRSKSSKRWKDSSSSSGQTAFQDRNAGPKIQYWQAFKDTLTDLLTTPDPHVGWVPDCIHRGKAIIRENNIEVIVATGSPWSSFLAGAWLKKTTGVPLVLDFRDPWVSNPGFSQRGRVAARLDRAMEKAVVRYADRIVANTQELANNFIQRFGLKTQKVWTVPNGFEHFLDPLPRTSRNPLTITHTGSLYFSRDPSPLLEAVAELIEGGEIPAQSLKLSFVGGIEVQSSRLRQLLECESLRGVLEVTPRLSFDKAQELMLESDVLLLLQPGFPLQVPRKLYEYLASRKPILCLAEPSGATARMVEEYGLGWSVQNRSEDIARSMKLIWAQWDEGRLHRPAQESLEPFQNANLTHKFRHVLKQARAGQ